MDKFLVHMKKMESLRSQGEYHDHSLRFTNMQGKKKIIPESWKENIDRLLTVDLLSANRYFAEVNPNIATLIGEVIKKDPENFFHELTQRWDWHNEYFEAVLEPAIGELLEKKSISLTPKRIDDIALMYRISSLVDQATLITTGAIKKYLERWSTEERVGILSDDERKMLFTPPVDTFMAEYQREHLKYVLAEREGSPHAQGMKEELLRKFHAEDEKIFEGRMRKFRWYFTVDTKEVEKEIENLSIDDSYKIKHFYFTVERPRLKALRDIVTFDNREEHHILTSLIGVSGFVLRKKVLEYLNETKILPNEGNIYQFNDGQIHDALQKLKQYRKNLMRRDVRGYTQTQDTCASASVMMAMNALFGTPLSREEEIRLHAHSQSESIPGAYFSALACQAAEAGAQVELLHSEENMFKNEGVFPQSVFQKLMSEYRSHGVRAKSFGVDIKNGVDLNEERIREYLENGGIPIVAGHLGSALHAVVVVGYSPDGLIVRDPLSPAPKVWRHGRLDQFMQTRIGSWMLVLSKKEGVFRAYESRALEFEKRAKEYIKS